MEDTRVAPARPGPEGIPPRRRSPLLWVGVGVALFAAAVVVILLLTADGDAPPATDADPQRVTAGSPQLNELIALLEQGQKETFHATYDASASVGTSEGESISIELWRSPPRVRQDVTISVEGQTATSAAFLLPDRALGCSRENAAAWTCTPIPEDQSTAPDSLARQITAAIEGGPVTVQQRRVAGLSVQCYTLPVSGASAEVCVTEDGIPALVASGSSRIELVELSPEFSQDVFTPPVGGA